MFMKHKFIIIGPTLIAVVSVCFFQTALAAEKEAKASETKSEKGGNLSSADRKFAENAAKGGMMEVAWGRQAASKAQNNDVKQFGNRMVTDHSKANDELKSIASKKGIKLPSAEPSANFKTDKAYMDMMVSDHEKDLAACCTSNNTDAALGPRRCAERRFWRWRRRHASVH